MESTLPAQQLIVCSQIQLSFTVGRKSQTVLDQLDLSVNSGQIVSLLGPSGCGKSTLLKVIAGLVDPQSGSTAIGDQLVSQRMQRTTRDRMAFVFQEPALLPWRTVWSNVMLPNELRGKANQGETIDRAKHFLNLVGLQQSDWKKLPSQLSGGMKMRASIARAMSTKPSILLLDEPFAALDDMLRSKLNDLLLTISAEEKCTMLFVTHNIGEAIYLSHEIAIMSRGKIAQMISVPFPFPRVATLRSTSEFAAFYGHVSGALNESHA
jgi:NitT/TauT family transport system ATP-binding protein